MRVRRRGGQREPPVSVNPNVGRVGLGLSNSQTGKFETVPPSTIVERTGRLSGVPSSLISNSSSIGWKKNGIDILIRAAREILNVLGSIAGLSRGSFPRRWLPVLHEIF